MKKVSLKGIITPIITPMHEDESINLQEFKRQVERQIAAGVHGIFCFGTNGEGYILDAAEKQQILEAAVQTVPGRVPVYAGTGCLSTKETIAQSQMAASAGANVLSIITPSFAAASQHELYLHYRAVAEAVDLPIVLYNIPARTGNALAADTVRRLAEIENIVGVKDSSGNFSNLLAYLDATKHREDFAVLCGNDQLIIWTLLAGGSGGIAGCANVYPELLVSVYEHFAAGRLEEAKAANAAIQSLRDCFRYGNPNTIIKMAVSLRGYPVGPCRAPFHHVAEEGVAAIKEMLRRNEELGLA